MAIRSIMCCCGQGLGSSMMVSMNVEKALKSAGLRLINKERHILRNEAESPVYGYIFTASKPEMNK